MKFEFFPYFFFSLCLRLYTDDKPKEMNSLAVSMTLGGPNNSVDFTSVDSSVIIRLHHTYRETGPFYTWGKLLMLGFRGSISDKPKNLRPRGQRSDKIWKHSLLITWMWKPCWYRVVLQQKNSMHSIFHVSLGIIFNAKNICIKLDNNLELWNIQ